MFWGVFVLVVYRLLDANVLECWGNVIGTLEFIVDGIGFQRIEPVSLCDYTYDRCEQSCHEADRALRLIGNIK
jgi:hypothetical protein